MREEEEEEKERKGKARVYFFVNFGLRFVCFHECGEMRDHLSKRICHGWRFGSSFIKNAKCFLRVGC